MAAHQVHFAAVRELDLSSCQYPNISDRINSVPAIKTSAAFFTFLRANLAINPSVMSSNPNTPQLEPWLPQAPLPSSQPSAADPQPVPLDDIPPLYLEPLEREEEKAAGLHLIAESVSQMSQQTARTLVFHPICLAALTGALSVVHQYSYKSKKDLGMTIVLFCGVIASYLTAIRFVASRYLTESEKIGWEWLQDKRSGQQDVMIGARFDKNIVGALVLKLEPTVAPVTGKKKTRAVGQKGGQGVIRAWTTQHKHRGQGVGRDLLYEAIRVTKERYGKDAEVGFAQEHVNSVMVLPEIFNKPFRQQEKQATRTLHDVLTQWEVSRKKR
ncbi:hypothetical protein S7711_00353 [Stachybotrys chartarum IBT 7711]|uniref:N-acetyltransferase domain-containing protein n=1 Tax=Stachybotrys chartarum (strain CBS 109288 / IBT 7711) TaxID=1280523 RepID=A0A084B9G4_STACB|nr:hypothetical protein S7711_00353 [Stachybotrys chartarum IBT 7711]